MSKELSYKLVIVGSGGVGKSCITVQYVRNEFTIEYDPTLEDTYRKQVKIDGKIFILDILDTAGQEEFSGLADSWYRDGNGFLIVYNITNRTSFNDVTTIRDKILRTRDVPSVPIVLVGNKCDLEAERAVTYAEGKNLAKSISTPFMETSAKTSVNISEAWTELVREVWRFEHGADAKGGCCVLL